MRPYLRRLQLIIEYFHSMWHILCIGWHVKVYLVQDKMWPYSSCGSYSLLCESILFVFVCIPYFALCIELIELILPVLG